MTPLLNFFPISPRDGEIYGLSVSYELFSGSNFPVRPKMSLSKGEYDGESSSFILPAGGRPFMAAGHCPMRRLPGPWGDRRPADQYRYRHR